MSSTAEQRTLLVHDGDGMPVVARHWRRHDARADHELAALGRAQGDHVTRLLDVGITDDGGLAALLERCPRGDLAALLRERDAFSAGELVTLIAPLAQALARLHDVGVAHRRVTAQRVLFDASGAPQLAGFGGAELFDEGLPPAHLERLDGVIADRSAMTALAAAVAERVPGGTGRRAGALIDEAARDVDDPLRALARGLFALASGSPIRFPVDAVGEVPGESLAEAVAPPAGSPTDDARSPRRPASSPLARATSVARPPRRRATVPPRRGRRRLDAPRAAVRDTRTPRRRARPSGAVASAVVPSLLDGAPVAAITAHARSGAIRLASTRRGRIAMALGATALLTVIALVAIPAPSSGDAGGGTTVGSGPDVRPSAPADASPSATAAEATTARESRHGTADVTRRGEGEAVTGADALAATSALLTARTECLRELDRTCLTAISEPGSSARHDDLALLARLDAGAATEADRRQVTLQAQSVGGDLGGAVVIVLTPDSEPASLLVMRGEAGWRIRTYQGAAG
ncbi:protein kinase [Schumannella sp. 10F1B-5-1]|uniref:protein kinase domain-containing protein n=1 Tax=Schumannella sp. 10F1B-5-1 TaxID=2590780 RepID=UPI0011306421|nr:protein kinase [Schumannella sp. 10F1B-5-1]TPW70862.1 protein kinase [Schumannella sp. 10F1B-5-1]